MTDSLDSQTGLSQKAPVVHAPLQTHVFVCTGKSCSSRDSEQTFQKFREVLAEKGLLYGKHGSPQGTVMLTTCGSVGLCQVGPAVLIYPEGVWYYNVLPEDVEEIIEQHLLGGQVVARLLAKQLAQVTTDTSK